MEKIMRLVDRWWFWIAVWVVAAMGSMFYVYGVPDHVMEDIDTIIRWVEESLPTWLR